MKVIAHALLLVLLFSMTVQAAPITDKNIPDTLKPWVDWVLYNQDQHNCPAAYNNHQKRFCTWASRLKLNLNNTEGKFQQHWQVHDKAWIRLPGDSKYWPQSVMVDDRPAIVLKKQGFPSVQLSSGSHTVRGLFAWDSLPESMTVPPSTGLLSITRNGQLLAFPRINQQGQLWLDKSVQKKNIENSVNVQVFRKIIDGHPMRIETRIILNVSGNSRDITFPKAQISGFIPLQLQSKLPARINQQGDLQLQVRPGNWEVKLHSYRAANVSNLTMPSVVHENWPRQEVWVFQADPSLRLANIEGTNAVDARQTRLPKEWHQYPAYLLEAKQRIILKTLQRGSAEPEPNRLHLRRTVWMDFDGKGYTLHDQISGTMTRGWRLSASPDLQLGRVSIDGEPQFITKLEPATLDLDTTRGQGNGVEVRRGSINLEADSRYTDNMTNLPITGWQHHFQGVGLKLFLPPGWTLFSAHGADNRSNTWVQRWTLLDLFMVLIISVAIARLWNWKWGVFGLFTMVLIWHEPNAPRYIWLNLLAVIALLRVLPKGLAKRLLRLYRNITFLALLLIVIPFIVSEVRQGLYPQLGLYSDYERVVNDNTQTTYSTLDSQRHDEDMVLFSVMEEEAEMDKEYSAGIVSSASKMLQKKGYAPPKKAKRLQQKNVLNEVDPNANIQTGPGLPTWNWQAVRFFWNSPVDPAQTLKLNFISPTVNMLLNFLRVALLLLLMSLLVKAFIQRDADSAGDTSSTDSKKWYQRFFKTAVILLLPIVFMIILMPEAQAEGSLTAQANTTIEARVVELESLLRKKNRLITLKNEQLARQQVETKHNAPVPPSAPSFNNMHSKKSGMHSQKITNATFPSMKLLDTLQKRLLAVDDCLPECALIEAMKLEVSADALIVHLKVHSANNSVIPLPANGNQWRPDSVLINHQPASALARDSAANLWIGMGQGTHIITLQGKLPPQSQLSLSLPLKPHRVTWQGKGWTVEGIREDHTPEQQLQLVRTQVKDVSKRDLMQQNTILPPLLHIERTLHLGLDWNLETNVTRLSPLGSPVSMRLPLFKNESVLSNANTVKNGKITISLGAMQKGMSWKSRLPVASSLKLIATQQQGLVESWKLDISTLWHVNITGIPEIHHATQNTEWLPEWKPWPGESINLSISRPEGVAGRTLTIERSLLTSRIGKRLRESNLTLRLRSSRGGQHIITLPENVELLSVSIDGKRQPVRQKERLVSLPISPGEQKIQLNWREAKKIGIYLQQPAVDLGVDSVNNSIHLNLARDRWILFAGGPQMGPAVLFWGVLIVILLGAIVLGRIKDSPLRIWQWFLLGVGLSLVTPFMLLIVVGWIMALKYRPLLEKTRSNTVFNTGQVLLVLFTLVAFGVLFFALKQGLLGLPNMQISGNGSYAGSLQWFQDRSPSLLSQPWVISIPLFVYRLLMLLWALWLAFALINWLKWGWHNFTVGGLWRKREMKETKEKS